MTIEEGLRDKFEGLTADSDLTDMLPNRGGTRIPDTVDAGSTVREGEICIENIHATYARTGSSIADSFAGRGERTLVLSDEAHHIHSPQGKEEKLWKQFVLDLAYRFRYHVGGLRDMLRRERRIGGLYWNQKDQAVLELGGHAEHLFLLWVVAAELAYQQNADVFGTVEDLAAHKARIAELEARRKDLYARFPSSWTHGDLFIGRITSDGAALITFRLASGEVPVHPPATAGERLVDWLLRKEPETEARAA